MRWVPPWLGKAYARIYLEKKTGAFGFSEASRILGIKDERPLAKILAKLKASGYLVARRDPTDPRRKIFSLVDPASIVLAFAIHSRAKAPQLAEKLRASSDYLTYYVKGAYAAYQYHHYLAPGSVDISVRTDQLPVWIPLLTEKETALSIDETPAEKTAAVNIHLHSDLDENFLEETKLIDRVRYLSPEVLVAMGLSKGDPSLEDVLAILIVERRKLNWANLQALSDAHGSTRYLGCVLDLLNFESRRVLFQPRLIKHLHKKSNLEVKLDFPSWLKDQPIEESYSSVSFTWNLRMRLKRSILSMIVTDLVRA